MNNEEVAEIAKEMMSSHRKNMDLLAISQMLSLVLVVLGAFGTFLVSKDLLKVAVWCTGLFLGFPTITERIVFFVANRRMPRI